MLFVYELQLFGVGRGATGRLLSLLAGRAFTFGNGRFTFARGVAFTFARGVAFTFAAAFTFGRFAFVVLFELAFALLELALLALAFSFSFRFLGRLGRFSLRFDELVLRFSLGSSGVTFSGVSPSFAARLMSMATV